MKFKAKIQKLLDILSKSLYQHKEVFLRELISNSVDSLEKMHLIKLKNKDIKDLEAELQINISFNEETKVITISDTGVGMTEEELQNNLGTIAGSGTEEFLKELEEKEKDDSDEKEEDLSKRSDLDIIGQFGIGFYSVFMVADKVEVRTNSYLKDEKSYLWTSDGVNEYTIEESDKETRGTDVMVHLKDGEEDFLSQYQIENVIKKYSNFVPYPIFVEDENKEEEKEEEKEDEKEGEEKEEKDVKEPKIPEPVNETTPIWKKVKADITDEEYDQFFNYLTHLNGYSHVINYSVEGNVVFNSIMYIPQGNMGMFNEPDVDYGPSLYSKNVLIMKNCKEIVPKWMRFIKGAVESDQIPLNISRDTIQSERRMIKISSLIVKKIIRDLVQIKRNEPEKYDKIYLDFGDLIKEGVVSDHKNQEKLKELIKFKTNKTKEDEIIDLDTYIKNMKKDQDVIYYLVGESIDTLRLSPHIGYYDKEGIEVILLDKPIDNFLMMNLMEYKSLVKADSKEEEEEKDDDEEEEDKEISYRFSSIDQTEEEKPKEKDENKDEDDEDKEDEEDDTPEDIKNLIETIKNILEHKVIDAKSSKKLYGNPCRLVNPAGGMSSSQQRAMRFWSQSQMGQKFPIPPKVFEFNPEHPVIKGLIKINEDDSDDPRLNAILNQLLENCLLLDGDLPDPTAMVPRINQIIEMFVTGNTDVKNILEEQEREKRKKDEKMLKKMQEEMDKKLDESDDEEDEEDEEEDSKDEKDD